MAAYGPGVLVIDNTGQQARDYDLLQEGDLVFFNAGSPDPAEIEHTGLYLGIDSEGNHRFISSRSKVNGPTLGVASTRSASVPRAESERTRSAIGVARAR